MLPPVHHPHGPNFHENPTFILHDLRVGRLFPIDRNYTGRGDHRPHGSADSRTGGTHDHHAGCARCEGAAALRGEGSAGRAECGHRADRRHRLRRTAARLAGRSRCRRSTSWRTRDCGTIAFTPRRCAARRARRCSPGTTITRTTRARSWNWRLPFPATPASVRGRSSTLAQILRQNGYSTGGVRQISRDAAVGGVGLRALRPLADRLGLRQVLRLHRRRDEPVGTGDFRRRDARGTGSRRLSLHHGHDGPGDPTGSARNRSLTPDKPFYLYFATGATHAPHHAPKEWIAKYKGQFTGGWDKLREETFERQKKMGVIPANTKLTPRPKEIPAWDDMSAEQKKLFERQMETFAGFAAHTDDRSRPARRAARERSARWRTRSFSTSSATTARAPRAARKAPTMR